MLTTRTWLLLIAAALLVIAGALNFMQRVNKRPPATDGVEWSRNERGFVVARSVATDSVAARAEIYKGDRLIAVSFSDETGSYEEIKNDYDVQAYIEQVGAGGNLHYLIERASDDGTAYFYYADLYGLDAVRLFTPRDVYLHLVGIVYLVIGFFVLFKQGGRAPYALHFAALCVAAFVFHFYKPLGYYEDLDAAIAYLDSIAFILFAPIFLHFCAIYPTQRRLVMRPAEARSNAVAESIYQRKRWTITTLIYLPSFVLILLTTILHLVPHLPFIKPGNALITFFTPERIGELYRLDFLHFTLALLIGSGILLYRFFRSGNAVTRQQLKWVVWGSTLAVLPFTLLYAVGYLTDSDFSRVTTISGANRLTDLAVLPLALIPLTFGNSVLRYRLMDVDIVVRRAAVYALTTFAIAVMIGTVVYLTGLYAMSGATSPGGEVFQPSFNSLRVIVAIAAMAAIVMTAAPLKNFLQEKTNRLFYGEQYDLRKGLADFGRTLSATTSLEPLLDALVRRLQQVLNVERIAIFIEDRQQPPSDESAKPFRVARTVGLSREIIVPPDFQAMIEKRAGSKGIVRADELELAVETPETPFVVPTNFVRRALHYYVPCTVRERMVAVIGLGRSANGALLSSEDLEVLRTVSGFVAVAIENSLLYEEQRERAAELILLKEFNESIVESINVGLLAVDVNGRVTRCNSALEEMLEIKRESILNHDISELFADGFTMSLQQSVGANDWHVARPRTFYKLYTATRDGKQLVLNIGISPLTFDERELAAANGALIVIEDATERSRLEEQLQQREKLSSIGLLAAGVAHEINTPLTGVSSYTQMLLGMMPEGDPKHTLLEKVQRQTDRAARIVGNLLNFSRSGSTAEFRPLNLNRVLEETMQLLEPQLRDSRIEVKREFAADLPETYGDGGKLQQVFTNLILNARDAITENSADETRLITLRTLPDETNDSIVIEVTDTGCGIDTANITKIFDPFFTTKEVGHGTGLGLAVTYGIIQEHSGHIAVESTREADAHGTTFRITLSPAPARQVLQATGD